jgi:hypothetical protein
MNWIKRYICKLCGKQGTKDALRHHICKRGIEKHYEPDKDDDSGYLNTLLYVDAITLLGNESEFHESEPEIKPGGGEFLGGGASGEYETKDDLPSEPESEPSEPESEPSESEPSESFSESSESVSGD